MISLINVSKSYHTGGTTHAAVHEVSLEVQQGEIFGIIGASGAGKSTLLRMINMLERPDSGRVIVAGEDLTALSAREIKLQRRGIGMIFQHFHLLHNRTVSGNVQIPLELSGMKRRERKQLAEEYLSYVGLLEKADAYPAELSGGQKQRVAIARALVSRPAILLCDEPTSSLDPRTTRSILDLLRKANEELGLTIIIVTHEMETVRSLCTRAAAMQGGRLVLTGSPEQVTAGWEDEVLQDG